VGYEVVYAHPGRAETVPVMGKRGGKLTRYRELLSEAQEFLAMQARLFEDSGYPVTKISENEYFVSYGEDPREGKTLKIVELSP